MGVITLHRPKALNALCDALFNDLIHAVMAFDHDENIGCVVITGSTKAFAAGECKTDDNLRNTESPIQDLVLICHESIQLKLAFLHMKQSSGIIKERISLKCVNRSSPTFTKR